MSRDSNTTLALRGLCIAPFFDVSQFPDEGYKEGRLCQELAPGLECCLPCPITDWVYPDHFNTLSDVASWISVLGTAACLFLLLSYAFLPVEKTNRHYLSISIVSAVAIMNMGFIIPLAAQPDQCVNEITPHGMKSSTVCAASATALLFGGFSGVMWVFMRAVSLHLQICWQQNVGRMFMIFSHASGWLVPFVVVTLALVFSGVSFRFGATCHINHNNSLADFWIPILLFAGLTALIQFATFGYCVKVYLASLADNSASTEGSAPTYTQSVRTMSPRHAYKRVRRVIALQWRGIAIVLIIVCDVIFFSVVFVFLDNTVQQVKSTPELSADWVACLAVAISKGGGKDDCLEEGSDLVVGQGIVIAVLFLLAINGLFLLVLLGRWSMVTGWVDLFRSPFSKGNNEFVSVDARYDVKNSQSSYEMLSKDGNEVVTSLPPVHLTTTPTSPRAGTKTPDFYGQTARYEVPSRSFSSPRPPTSPTRNYNGWDSSTSYARPVGQGSGAFYEAEEGRFQFQERPGDDRNPLGMNRI